MTDVAHASHAAAAAPVNLADFEPLARAAVTPMAWDSLSGGGGDELTLRDNRAAFDRVRLLPRVMRDVSRIDLSIELLGETHPFPILLAPTGSHRLFHPDGEVATVRGAAAAGVTLVASTVANVTIEDMARAADARLWFQAYVQRDREFSLALLRRAEDAGCRAVCLTVDTPLLGPRDRERRAGMVLPPGVTHANLTGLATADRLGEPYHAQFYNPFLDASLTWTDVAWFKSHARVPLVVKGVLSPADAVLAIEHGADAIVVSNHGGRGLDTAPAALDALPAGAAAVAGRVPRLLDGGGRRGPDVLKALAFGARAVMIGRPYLWGLAAFGAEGVTRVTTMLRDELMCTMALCGLVRIADIGPEAIWRGVGREG